MNNAKSSLGSPDNFFAEIRQLVITARTAAARSVNLIQVYTNFEIGKRIVEQEQRGENRAEYGKQLLKVLSEQLTEEFGNGFSKSNLEYMRRFYLAYQNRLSIAQTVSGQFKNVLNEKKEATQSPIVQSVIGQSAFAKLMPFKLGWSHYIFLLSIQTPDERSFYEIEAAEQNWTVRELKRQFNSGLYERLALSRDKESIKKLAEEGQVITDPRDIFKELYWNFWGWMTIRNIQNPISKLPSSIKSKRSCWSWEKAFCLKHAKNVLPMTKNTSLWI